MNSIIWGKWNKLYKEIVNIKNEESRKKMYNKEPYSIVIGENMEHPYCFLEIGVTRIFVGFLDENKDMYLSYDWDRKENGKLFLQVVTLYEYHINNYGNQEIKKKVSHTFSQEGFFKVVTYDNVDYAFQGINLNNLEKVSLFSNSEFYYSSMNKNYFIVNKLIEEFKANQYLISKTDFRIIKKSNIKEVSDYLPR